MMKHDNYRPDVIKFRYTFRKKKKKQMNRIQLQRRKWSSLRRKEKLRSHWSSLASPNSWCFIRPAEIFEFVFAHAENQHVQVYGEWSIYGGHLLATYQWYRVWWGWMNIFSKPFTRANSCNAFAALGAFNGSSITGSTYANVLIILCAKYARFVIVIRLVFLRFQSNVHNKMHTNIILVEALASN